MVCNRIWLRGEHQGLVSPDKDNDRSNVSVFVSGWLMHQGSDISLCSVKCFSQLLLAYSSTASPKIATSPDHLLFLSPLHNATTFHPLLLLPLSLSLSLSLYIFIYLFLLFFFGSGEWNQILQSLSRLSSAQL